MYFQTRGQEVWQIFFSCSQRVIITICLLIILWAPQTLAQNKQVMKPRGTCRQMGVLVPSKVIETAITGLQSYCYRITCKERSFFQITIQSNGLELLVRITGNRDLPLTERIIPADSGEPTQIYWLAQTSGVFSVQVRSRQPVESVRVLKIGLADTHSPLPKDEQRVAAQEEEQAAMVLLTQGNEVSTRKALENYQAALKNWQLVGDRKQEAYTIGTLGEIYAQIGDVSKAFDHSSQAASIFHEIGDRVGEANCLNTIGAVYHNQGNTIKALEFYDKAIRVLQGVTDLSTEANILNNKGRAYQKKGDIPNALLYYTQSLEAARKCSSVRGQCYSLVSIGDLYRSTGEMQKALDLYNQALPLIRNIHEVGLEATTLGNMGLLYEDLGDNQKAFRFFNEALQLARTLGDPIVLLYKLNDLGTYYGGAEDYQKAIGFYNEAIDLSIKIKARHFEANLKHNLGRVYVDQEQYKKALALFNDVLSLVRDMKDKYGEARTLTSMGRLYSLLGDKSKALESLNQALILKREVKDKDGEADTLYILALVKRDDGDLTGARLDIEAAIKLVDALRESVLRLDLRATFFATLHRYYDFDVDLLMRMHKQFPNDGYDTLALEASERARARNLLALLSEAKIDVDKGVDPNLISKRKELLNRIGSLEKTKYDKLVSKAKKQEIAKTEADIENAIEEYRNLETQIRRNSPALTSLNTEPLLMREIQNLLDDDTLLLYYALGESKSFLWSVSKDSIKSYEIPGQKVIVALARAVFNSAEKKTGTSEKKQGEALSNWTQADVVFFNQAAELSAAILRPVVNQLARKRLLIVGDGILQLVPFSALPNPSSVITPAQKSNQIPLVNDHEIVMLPSATALAAIRGNVDKALRPSNLMAVFADPVFEANDPRIHSRPKSNTRKSEVQTIRQSSNTHELVTRAASESGAALQRLYFTGGEADFIDSLTAGKNVVYKSFQANRSNALNKDLTEYRLIHFATHGLVNNIHPELSGIVLSLYDENGKPQDGFLKLIDIYNLKLPADLVVLSACQTAIGKPTKGEGLEALSRGFLHAGAKSVIATLWRIDDQATAKFMRFFYEAMLGPKNLKPAAALQEAQKNMRGTLAWRSPHYWSGFVLQGDWK